jgi:hypothetical protein
MKYIKIFRLKAEGGGVATHLEGIGDSYTLCGFDTEGDEMVHEKPPEWLTGKHRVTCDHCQQIIAIVREHLKASNRVVGRIFTAYHGQMFEGSLWLHSPLVKLINAV